MGEENNLRHGRGGYEGDRVLWSMIVLIRWSVCAFNSSFLLHFDWCWLWLQICGGHGLAHSIPWLPCAFLFHILDVYPSLLHHFLFLLTLLLIAFPSSRFHPSPHFLPLTSLLPLSPSLHALLSIPSPFHLPLVPLLFFRPHSLSLLSSLFLPYFMFLPSSLFLLPLSPVFLPHFCTSTLCFLHSLILFQYLESSLPFSQVTVGCEYRTSLTLTNNSAISVELILDLTDHSEFAPLISPPGKSIAKIISSHSFGWLVSQLIN